MPIFSRLDLSEPPFAFDLAEVSIPVSFAEWKSGTASGFDRTYHWQGDTRTVFLPAAPFTEAIEVRTCIFRPC